MPVIAPVTTGVQAGSPGARSPHGATGAELSFPPPGEWREANRRASSQLLTSEEARCQRYGHPACVLVIDLNGLKRLNDSPRTRRRR